MEWTRILAYITGTVDQELLLRNEYLAAENRILMAKLNGRPRFSDFERATLGEIGFRLGRRVDVAGITAHPDVPWMEQIARNVTMDEWGILCGCRYLLHDRDTKYSAAFRATIELAHIDTLPLPARSPNLNAHAERWVRSVKAECLSKIIPFGERPLRRAMNDYLAHYHTERNHQGKNNVLPFPQTTETRRDKPVRCRDRLGGLLRYYHRAAA